MKKPLQVYDPNNRTWREVQPAKANRQKGYMYINNEGTGMWAQQEPTRVVSNHLIPCDPPLEYTFGAKVLAMASKKVQLLQVFDPNSGERYEVVELRPIKKGDIMVDKTDEGIVIHTWVLGPEYDIDQIVPILRKLPREGKGSV